VHTDHTMPAHATTHATNPLACATLSPVGRLVLPEHGLVDLAVFVHKAVCLLQTYAQHQGHTHQDPTKVTSLDQATEGMVGMPERCSVEETNGAAAVKPDGADVHIASAPKWAVRPYTPNLHWYWNTRKWVADDCSTEMRSCSAVRTDLKTPWHDCNMGGNGKHQRRTHHRTLVPPSSTPSGWLDGMTLWT
jgi:hypothetical protein